jgi:DNA-binding GntR family transcriptional regulator
MPSTPTGPEAVLDAIREAILQGEFVPDQRLVEADLCSRFSANRGAVRGALLRLTEEGLVERVQNRGARVRAVSVEEAVEICEVRMVLEGLCAAKAAARVTAAQCEELRRLGERMTEAVNSGDVMGYSQRNQELHRLLRRYSGQSTAEAVLERLRAQSVRHQFRLSLVPGRPNVSLPEHLAIIEAVCAHDPERAERAARDHLASVIEALKDTARGEDSARPA